MLWRRTMGKVYVLNSPIITGWGVFSFRPVTPQEAKQVLAEGFTSAIGHEATAQALSKLLGMAIPVNRVAIQMEPGDKAIVFRLLKRIEEGRVLSSIQELEEVGFELGLMQAHEWACPWCGESIIL
jgi:hypothetical protein